MKIIARERYPSERLPEDLHEGLPPGSQVAITVLAGEERPEKVLTLEEIFALRQSLFRSAKEIDSELCRQRDEWDD
jgi:hypothetical protein